MASSTKISEPSARKASDFDAAIEHRTFAGREIMSDTAAVTITQSRRNDQFRQLLTDNLRARVTETRVRRRD